MEKASVGLEAPRPVQKPGAPLRTQKPGCTPLSTLKGYMLVFPEFFHFNRPDIETEHVPSNSQQAGPLALLLLEVFTQGIALPRQVLVFH